MRAAYRWSSSPCSQSQRALSPHKSAFVVPQDATRLNQGHCGSPEDNPVFTLPASDPASPNPEGSASGGNPGLVPWMYHDGATAGLVSRMATGLHPVDLQGERLLMERTAANARLLIHQFATLSALLFRSAEPEEAAAGDKRARTDLFREKLL